MDTETQASSSVAGSCLASPLVNLPARWNDDSRTSTVASYRDVKLPPGYSPALSLRREKASSAWSFGQRLLAFAGGVVLGASGTAWLARRSAGELPPIPAGATGPYAVPEPPSEVPLAYMFSPALNNSCLIPSLEIPDGPQTFDACGFVVKSTDEIWNLRGDVDAAIEKYFHEDYVDAGSWGRRIIGKKALRQAVFSEMRAFPDIRIHITDCVCKGNDNDGYKCAMPDVLTGTNLGPSGYGPPTGRYARWTGMVQSLVQRNPQTGQWQYVAEWGVHDEWALIQQLGLDFARVPHPAWNAEPLHDCAPLLQFSGGARMNVEDAAMQQAHIRARQMAGR